MPQSLDDLFQTGSLALRDRDYVKAVDCFQHMNKLSPNNPVIMNKLGQAIAMSGRFSKAYPLFQMAVKLKPDYWEAVDSLGRVHRELGNFAEAIKCFKSILKKHPRNADILDQLGLTYLDNQMAAKALPLFKKASKIEPSSTQFAFNLGSASLAIGAIEDAENAFRNAIKHCPEDTGAYEAITSIKKFNSIDDPDIHAMQKLLDANNLNGDGFISINFALGKAYDDIGEWHKAFRYFKTGNDIKFKNFSDYDPLKETSKIEKILNCIDAPTVISRKSSNPDASPIFIVGMPRSGTTLAEQILSSHKSVYGAGELDILPKTIKTLETAWQADYPNFTRTKTTADLKQIADVYLSATQKLKGKAAFFTDKLPYNFRFLGLINMIMPQAKIINLVRNPVDTCLSCYRMNFNTAQEFSFDLEALGQYYNDYRKLMAHWEQTLPTGKIYNLPYELLVSAPEEETKKLLEYCDLPWDENCLNFHKNKRTVATASASQVRNPIHSKSVERWRNYESDLQRLLTILENG